MKIQKKIFWRGGGRLGGGGSGSVFVKIQQKKIFFGGGGGRCGTGWGVGGGVRVDVNEELKFS